VERGNQTTLSWDSTNANSILIDGGVGNVAETGSIVITPGNSLTYTAIARGPGGEDRASVRVTVVEPEKPVDISTDSDRVQELIDGGKVLPVFFDYDKADLSAEAKEILTENARIFRTYPNAKVVVEGHCDERGTEEYNLALGDRRAIAARDFLVLVGVDPGQLDTVSFGEERPFALGQDEAAFALNRRAHFSTRR
jgi:peptidoglycan-associated lipoprotein